MSPGCWLIFLSGCPKMAQLDGDDEGVDLYDLHHYAESVRSHPKVGDAIREFQAKCGGDYCEGCGKPDVSAGQCKGCHVARYCTIACQQQDWGTGGPWACGGHAEECKAIVDGELMDASGQVGARHLVRCSALALAKMATDKEDPAEPDSAQLAAVQLHIGSFLEGAQFEPIGKNWMHGAVKHPGALKAAAARADHGRYKGRATAFAHHVLFGKDHKHGSKLLRQRARLALTFARFRGHHRGK